MESNKMMTGDQYGIPFHIYRDGQTVTEDEIEVVEFSISNLRKVYPQEVRYVEGDFLFPITQQETFSLGSGKKHTQARVKFVDGSVVGVDFGYIDVSASISKVVL